MYRYRVTLRMIVGGIEQDFYVDCDKVESTTEDYLFYRDDEPNIQHSAPRRNVVAVWVSDEVDRGADQYENTISDPYTVTLTEEQARFLVALEDYVVQPSPLSSVVDKLMDAGVYVSGEPLRFDVYDKGYEEFLGRYRHVMIREA